MEETVYIPSHIEPWAQAYLEAQGCRIEKVPNGPQVLLLTFPAGTTRERNGKQGLEPRYTVTFPNAEVCEEQELRHRAYYSYYTVVSCFFIDETAAARYKEEMHISKEGSEHRNMSHPESHRSKSSMRCRDR